MEKRVASFYCIWLDNEKVRQRAYMKEMYRRTFAIIALDARLKLQRLRWAIQNVTTRNLF